jgi:hypothetical protein
MTGMFYSFGNCVMPIERFHEYKRDDDDASQFLLVLLPARSRFSESSSTYLAEIEMRRRNWDRDPQDTRIFSERQAGIAMVL